MKILLAKRIGLVVTNVCRDPNRALTQIALANYRIAGEAGTSKRRQKKPARIANIATTVSNSTNVKAWRVTRLVTMKVD